MVHLVVGNREGKTGTLAGPGPHPDRPAVAFHDSLAYGQAHARAGVLVACVQPLKNREDPFVVLRIDPDAVILDPQGPAVGLTFGRDPDVRRTIAAKLHRVADEVLQQPDDLHPVGRDGRQGSGLQRPAGLA